MSARRIDLVDFGQLKVFMYMDDLAYVQVQEKYKHAVPNKQIFSRPPLPPLNVEAVYQDPQAPLLHTLMAHHWVNELDFTVLDVGCQYGSSAITIAQFILQCGKRSRVVAFEPGVAGGLAAFNCKINGVEGILDLETLAVTDGCYPTLLYTELGHSENNRVVNRVADVETASFVVWGTSIDDYVARKGIDTNLIVKVDTQGAEVEVFSGMAGVMGRRHITAITEFTPWALATRVNPAEWLRQFQAGFRIFDIFDLGDGPSGSPGAEVAEPLEDFVSSVSERPSRYTDLLLAPRGLPDLDGLVARLRPTG